MNRITSFIISELNGMINDYKLVLSDIKDQIDEDCEDDDEYPISECNEFEEGKREAFQEIVTDLKVMLADIRSAASNENHPLVSRRKKPKLRKDNA